MKYFKSSVYFVAAFVLTLGGLAAFFLQSKLFEVSRIPVEVVDTHSRADELLAPDLRERILQKLATENSAIQGHKIWDIDISSLQKLLQSEEWVSTVRISRVLPNTVKVSVQPKVPFALLISDKMLNRTVTAANMKIIGSDASLLPLPGVNLALDLPIVRGEKLAEDGPAAVSSREKLIEFINSLPSAGLLSKNNVAEISYSKDDGYTLFLITTKAEVKLGDERVPIKIARVSQVLDYLAANNLKGRVIDASFSKKVLVRLRKDP